MKQLRFCFFVLFCALVVGKTWSYNILYISTMTSGSHHIWDKTLATALHQRGHSITFVTHTPEKSYENFTVINLEGVYEKISKHFAMEELGEAGKLESINLFYYYMNIQATFDSETKGLQELVKLVDGGSKFDLLIMDLIADQFMYPIIDKLGYPPAVGTSPFGLTSYFTFHFGLDVYTPYIPLWMMPYTDKMTFYERIQNYFYTMIFLYKRQFDYLPKQKLLAEKVFGKNAQTNIAKLEKHFTLLLSNSDPILDYPMPVPPAVIHVGGLHTKREKSLPEDLKSYMDNSKDGVIFFSLGTNVRSDQLKVEKRDAIIKALSKLKQNVIWKYESEINNLPKNILIQKFFPQNDILAHSNTKLFISHGGGLSTQEAMFHGIPVVGIPFFADQHVNIHKLIARKLGLKVDYNTLTEETVFNTINEILNNPVYSNNMKAISRRYRDQPQNALERAVFWVEYAIRHKGAEHLRLAARDMPIYELYFLDLWGIFLITVLLVRYVVFSLLSKKFRKSKLKQKKN